MPNECLRLPRLLSLTHPYPSLDRFVMEGFLEIKLPMWQRMLVTRCVALIPAVVVAIGTENHPTLSDQLDQWLNILQSVQLPFALLPVLSFTSQAAIMGIHKNGFAMNAVCTLLALVVFVINVTLVVQFVGDDSSPVPHESWFYAVVGLFGCVYFGFIGYFSRGDLRRLFCREQGDDEKSAPLLNGGLT